MSKYIDDLKEIQKQYYGIINSCEIYNSDADFYIKAVSLIDRCEAFWLSKKTQLSLILNDLTQSKKCFLLSGAIYLDVEGKGHYAFGALGDINIINDPIIRMRGFFANGLDGINEYTKTYFCEAFADILKIENQYSDEFMFISTDVMYDSFRQENSKLINKVYWDIISYMLNKEFRSVKDLFKGFDSVDAIEKSLTEDKLKCLIFNNVNDVDLSLAERINKFFEDSELPVTFPYKNEISRFHFALFSQIQQTIEIIIKCLQFNLIPFIRYDVTIRYFLLIGGAFSKDFKLKEIIDYSILSYLYSEYAENDDVYKSDFKIFYNKCKQQHFIENVYSRVCSNGQDMHSMHITDVNKVIREELFALLGKSQIDK